MTQEKTEDHFDEVCAELSAPAGSSARGEDVSSDFPTPKSGAAGHSPAHTSTVFTRHGGLGAEHGLVASADTGSARPRRRYQGAKEPRQIAARRRAGRLPLRQEKIDAYDERKTREADAAEAKENEVAELVEEARGDAREHMRAKGAPLLAELQIWGRKRWMADPRYARTGLTQREEDVRYFLEYLPTEVEWAFWVVDKNLMRAGDKLVPRSTQSRSLEWLHRWAEEDALSFADEAARRRKEDKAKPPRDRVPVTLFNLSLWVPTDDVDANGDLVRINVPSGYSLWLWGRPRHEPIRPDFTLKRSELSESREAFLAGRTLEEYIIEAAKGAGYGLEEFIAPFKRGRRSPEERSRYAALAATVVDLDRAGFTQQALADATGLSQSQVSRLKKSHLQGKR
jgi:hypothetical protein